MRNEIKNLFFFLNFINFSAASSPRLTLGATCVSGGVAPVGKHAGAVGHIHTAEAVRGVIEHRVYTQCSASVDKQLGNRLTQRQVTAIHTVAHCSPFGQTQELVKSWPHCRGIGLEQVGTKAAPCST